MLKIGGGNKKRSGVTKGEKNDRGDEKRDKEDEKINEQDLRGRKKEEYY